MRIYQVVLKPFTVTASTEDEAKSIATVALKQGSDAHRIEEIYQVEGNPENES